MKEKIEVIHYIRLEHRGDRTYYAVRDDKHSVKMSPISWEEADKLADIIADPKSLPLIAEGGFRYSVDVFAHPKSMVAALWVFSTKSK